MKTATPLSSPAKSASVPGAPNQGVPLLDIQRGNGPLREALLASVGRVLDSGRFLHGPEVSSLEASIAKLCQTKHAIGCASGSDALLLALMAIDLQPGDEVIVPSFTFFATASCVWRLGGKVIFVDIDPDTYNMSVPALEAAITPRTKAVIPVHLFGQCARLDQITRVANKHSIHVIEDAAQAIGASYQGKMAGAWGVIGCLSFYPTKNLGGMGDGGMMVCQDDQINASLRLNAAHGMQPRYYHHVVGINSRLDTIQAAMLEVKLAYLSDYAEARRANAARYLQMFAQANLEGIIGLPYQDPDAHHVWNQFSIRVPDGRRDALRASLTEQKIGTEIYYPIPLHLQKCFESLGHRVGSFPETERASLEILHLPVYPELTIAEQEQVVEAIANFYLS